jgi:hypothetical protein
MLCEIMAKQSAYIPVHDLVAVVDMLTIVSLSSVVAVFVKNACLAELLKHMNLCPWADLSSRIPFCSIIIFQLPIKFSTTVSGKQIKVKCVWNCIPGVSRPQSHRPVILYVAHTNFSHAPH